MNVIATINGLHALSLRIELRRGGAASTFEATLPPGARIAPGPVEIEVRDGDTQRVFRQFEVETVEKTGEGRVVAIGSDLRRDWTREAAAPEHADTAQQFVARLFASAGLGAQAPRVPDASLPAGRLRGGTLGQVFERFLSLSGLTCTVDDNGETQIVQGYTPITIDQSRLLELLESNESSPSEVHIFGAPAVELTDLTEWEAVVPDNGVLRPLADVLSDWGIDERAARQACLSDGGFEQLVPKTGDNTAERLAALKRHAFRLFRAVGEHSGWLPFGGVDESGALLPPALKAMVARGIGLAPQHPREDAVEQLHSTPIEGFELDPEAGTIFMHRPPFALAADSPDDPTVQARRVQGEARLTLSIAVASEREPFTLVVPGGGEGEPVSIHAPHLVGVYNSDGTLLNRAELTSVARDLAARFARAQVRRQYKLAGVADALAAGTCDRVVIQAGRDGLTSKVIESPLPLPEFAGPRQARANNGHPAGPAPSGLYQPINAFRAGPLVVRTYGDVPEGESVVAMEATNRDPQTGALTLEHRGSLAFPFFLASEDAAKFGRWFFVAGVEVADTGRLRVLAPDDRHAEIPPKQLFEARHVAPRGLRGLIVSLGDEPQFVDSGPLIADARGRDTGASSSLVYDLDGSRLSERKRGGLQFLTVLVLSPAHQAEGTRDRGWAPALNFREGDTANPETLGRGLFAEGHGRDLGRLTAKQQGGPILGDGAGCTKHLYGTAGDDDGVYRETAGHISTDAFFKVPGDPVHDAPVKFYAQPFEGAVPPWRPYEAQIKYDATEQHDWNRTKREGRWKIQYRVPFLPEIPPTWDPPIGPPEDPPPVDDPPKIVVPVPSYVPRDVRPAISEYELWAPSHDWVPAPSDRRGGETPFPGPSIKSEGWAGEVDGVPDPSLGGGCIYLPPGLSMPDAQSDDGTRHTFLALHPEVVLALGHPDFASGRIHSGWAIQLAGGDLQLLPRDDAAATPPGLTRGVHITGHLNIGPDGANFDNTQALRLGENDDEGISFGEDVQLYREAEGTLRTDASVEIGGKLSVEGLIDPTGLELDPQPGNPGGAPGNTLWISTVDSRLRVGGEVLAYASEIIADKQTVVLSYTGSGLLGKTVTLTGINRAHVLLIFRDDAAAEGCVLALPMGATGDVRDRNLSEGGSEVVLNLNAPGAGAQTLTINSTAGSRNADGVNYRLLVIGTP